ncbi:hypothetical protein D8B26_001339 [Coccidioides posadasii str. Silveira]|uniref:Mediator of RNA polymerase II transcription subunit 9 n=1 Tax=Coccidioides posadasii (strain RMSCC 757 / Silveira) TaxID=443226 RepID=E9D9T9_COCPS|nr:conserved hypothetical protein [Coccidioides posadasii str. Silveira]QVM06635.1 hypothetical protein D8B26_001339 [Coccidioides posadasii str. Silveira]
MSAKHSPVAPSPAHKTPVTHSTTANTTANTPAAPQDPMSPSETTPTVPFPPPQTFDILPPLHALFVRLLSTPPHAQQAAATNPDATSALGESSLLTTAGIDATEMHSLDPRALTTGASTVKIRIQKARSAIEELPDINRSVAEQEEEIKHLEQKIARLRDVIQDFGRRSRDVINGQ